MCEFCETTKKIEQANRDVAYIIRYGELELHTLIIENKDSVKTALDITYCPLCGRKLDGCKNLKENNPFLTIAPVYLKENIKEMQDALGKGINDIKKLQDAISNLRARCSKNTLKEIDRGNYYTIRFRTIEEEKRRNNNYLICDDLVVPIEESIGKEKLEEILKSKPLENKGKVATGSMTINVKEWDKIKKRENNIIPHPSHYCDGRKYEPKDVIRDWGLNFNIGSACKYLSRAGRKGDIIEDLEKAKQFIQFEIDYLKEVND